MRALLAGIALGLAALTLAAPAQATTRNFYFLCTGAAPLQTTNVTAYNWSATAPTKSYQEGAGCGWADPFVKGTNQPNALYDAAFGGLYRGEIERIDLTLYAPGLSGNPLAAPKTIDVSVRVGGVEVAAFPKLEGTQDAGPNQGISKYTWTLDHLGIKATSDDKQIVIAVAQYWSDDTGGWLLGTKEVPSGVKIYEVLDVPEDPFGW